MPPVRKLMPSYKTNQVLGGGGDSVAKVDSKMNNTLPTDTLMLIPPVTTQEDSEFRDHDPDDDIVPTGAEDECDDFSYGGSPVLALPRRGNQPQPRSSSSTCCISFTVLAALVVGLVGLASRTPVAKYLLVKAAIEGEMGQLVADMDTSTSFCRNPVKHSCGHYATTASVPRTKQVDMKRKVADEILALAQEMPQQPSNSWGWQQFLSECIAVEAGSDLAAGKSTQWRLTRGLPAAGIMYGRTRSEDMDRRERVATVFDLVRPGPCDLLNVMCESTNLTNLVGPNEPLCIASMDSAAMCDRLSRTENLDHPPALVSRTWCIEEALILWPSATSAAYEKYHHLDQFEVDAVAVFDAIKTELSHKLYAQRQRTLGDWIKATTLHTKHSAPPEQYKYPIITPYLDFATRWAETRKQHYEANMALQFYGSNQWEITGTHIGLFYDPLFNAVYLPAATSVHMWSPSPEIRIARLGYLFAQELSDAIVLADLSESGKGFLAKTKSCYSSTFNLSNDQLQEAISHRVAAAVVARLTGTQLVEERLLCNPDCIIASKAGRAYTAMVQLWCTADPTDADTTSLVNLAINQNDIIARAWGCKPPATTIPAPCPAMGA